MQIPRHQIESSLCSKGFEEERSSDHRRFHHIYKGKKTGISTKTSHGSEKKYKDYQDPLLGKIKQQLKLDSKEELRDFLLCPMSGEEYNQKLRSKGFLPE